MTRGELGRLRRMAEAMRCDLVEVSYVRKRLFFTVTVRRGDKVFLSRMVSMMDDYGRGKRVIETVLETVGRVRAGMGNDGGRTGGA